MSESSIITLVKLERIGGQPVAVFEQALRQVVAEQSQGPDTFHIFVYGRLITDLDCSPSSATLHMLILVNQA
jgi:predicted SpoU family rRNA methylase